MFVILATIDVIFQTLYLYSGNHAIFVLGNMKKKVSNIIVNFFDANPEFQNAFVQTCVTIIFEWTKDLLSLQRIFYHLLSCRCHVGQWTKTQATISAYLLLKSVFVA